MNNRYTPVTLLGSGGMADVYLTVARGHRGVTKLSVVKRLRENRDAWLRAMFLDEARVATRLNHPNVVRAYETWEAKGEHFLAMEYVEGMPLNELLRELSERKGSLSQGVAAYIAAQVLKGLHYVHELRDFDGTSLDIVHRDVSPHNICITYDGEVKLLDFGVAKSTLNVTHTQQGALKGKVRYMAPEQARAEGIDRRADVFALGIVLWEMLAAGPLFNGHPLAVLGRVMRGDIPPVRSVNARVSPELEAVAERALRLEKNERYATADQMRDALSALTDSQREEAARGELARSMQELFAPARDVMRSQVQACIAMLKTSDGDSSTSGSLVFFASDWGAPQSSPSVPAHSGDVTRAAVPVRMVREAPCARARPRVGFALAVTIVVGATLILLAMGNARRRATLEAATVPVGSPAAEWPPPVPPAVVSSPPLAASAPSQPSRPDATGATQAMNVDPVTSHHGAHRHRDRGRPSGRGRHSPKIKMLDDEESP